MGFLTDWVVPALMLAVAAGITLWVAGAIFFDLCRGTNWGRWVAAGWVVGIVVLFVVWQPLWQAFLALLGMTGLFLVWWFSQKPSHEREWDPSVTKLPRVVRQDDVLTFENIRNFSYRSLEDFTPRYDTRTVNLSNLRGVDMVLFNWGSPWMSHPVLVFDFGPDGRICISIEVRYRKGQVYSILRSLYRQQELIFLVADERDAILRRTKHGKPQTAHLYHLVVTPERLRSGFLDYVGAVNDLFERPQWYHGISRNCTTTFYRLPNSRFLRDWRVIANGRIDQALYGKGRLDRSLPFDELRRLSHVNDIVNEAPEADFGDHVRRELDRRLQDHRESVGTKGTTP